MWPKICNKTYTEHDPKRNIHTEKRGGGSFMLYGCFSASETGNLVRAGWTMDGAKHASLEENLLVDTRSLRLVWKTKIQVRICGKQKLMFTDVCREICLLLPLKSQQKVLYGVN